MHQYLASLMLQQEGTMLANACACQAVYKHMQRTKPSRYLACCLTEDSTFLGYCKFNTSRRWPTFQSAAVPAAKIALYKTTPFSELYVASNMHVCVIVYGINRIMLGIQLISCNGWCPTLRSTCWDMARLSTSGGVQSSTSLLVG
jgi:hypothetical protein